MTGADSYRLATAQRHNQRAAAAKYCEQQLAQQLVWQLSWQLDQQLDQVSVWHRDMLPHQHPAAVLAPAGKILAAAIESMVSAVEKAALPARHLLEPRRQVCQVEGWSLAVVQDTSQRQQTMSHAV